MATEKISTSIIADDAVTTAKVADDAITGALIENNPTIAGNLAVAGTSTLTGALSVDTISEKTSANGVTIDGVNLKDSQVPASAGSSLVYLAKYTADDSVNTLYFNLGSYTAYNTYKLIFENVIPDENNKNLYLTVSTTTSPVTSGYYQGVKMYASNGSGTSDPGYQAADNRLLSLGNNSGNASGEGGVSGEAHIFGPLNSSTHTYGQSFTVEYEQSNYVQGFVSHGLIGIVNSTPYIHITTSSTHIATGNIILFGVKNA